MAELNLSQIVGEDGDLEPFAFLGYLASRAEEERQLVAAKRCLDFRTMSLGIDRGLQLGSVGPSTTCCATTEIPACVQRFTVRESTWRNAARSSCRLVNRGCVVIEGNMFMAA